MAAPKAAARKPRRKEKKNIALGQAHIKSTFNNTIVSITDPSGAVIAWASGGDVGFKGSRKSTPYAAGMAAEAHEITAPVGSVIVTMVLLNVLLMWAWPTATFFFSLRRGLRAAVLGVAMMISYRAFFLPATVRFGPLRVRALVLVR